MGGLQAGGSEREFVPALADVRAYPSQNKPEKTMIFYRASPPVSQEKSKMLEWGMGQRGASKPQPVLRSEARLRRVPLFAPRRSQPLGLADRVRERYFPRKGVHLRHPKKGCD